MAAKNDTLLEYSPPPPWHRRRRARRVAIGLVIAALAVAAMVWGPGAWRRGRLLYYQHQCLTFSAPADAVVYEPDPARVPFQLKQGLQFWGTAPSPSFAIAADPPCLRRLTSMLPAPGISTGSGLGFMHELRNHKGDRRLVLIAPPSDPSTFDFCIARVTRAFGPVQGGIRYMGSCYSVIHLGFAHEDPNLRIFAGQVDPDDPSHFTFRYESPKGNGTIDGWLTDACDIHMRVRDGPATQPPPDPAPVMIGPPSLMEFDPFPRPAQDLIDDRPRRSGKPPAT